MYFNKIVILADNSNRLDKIKEDLRRYFKDSLRKYVMITGSKTIALGEIENSQGCVLVFLLDMDNTMRTTQVHKSFVSSAKLTKERSEKVYIIAHSSLYDDQEFPFNNVDMKIDYKEPVLHPNTERQIIDRWKAVRMRHYLYPFVRAVELALSSETLEEFVLRASQPISWYTDTLKVEDRVRNASHS